MDDSLTPLGDSAVLVRLGDRIDLATNRRVHALERRLRQGAPAGIREAVPGYATLLVHYDPLVLQYGEVAAWLARELEQAGQTAAQPARLIEVPVRYGGADGPDLETVAAMHRVSPAEIVRLHTAREYTVFMMGFTPGFPYMGTLDEALITPRLETPRTHVPAGSVGIAGAQTGIYPIESPGGWQIVGRTSLRLFDPAASEPFLFAPGDRVRFRVERADA